MNKFLLTICLLFSTLIANASDLSSVFGQGSTQFSLLAGSGYAFNNNYLVLGAGISYFVRDGIGVGLSYENWSGNSPSINKTSPSVQYVFHGRSALRPYVGGFLRHSVISGLPSINSVGARAGVYFSAGPRGVVGVGLASESYLNCKTAIYSSCGETYPEVSYTFSY